MHTLWLCGICILYLYTVFAAVCVDFLCMYVCMHYVNSYHYHPKVDNFFMTTYPQVFHWFFANSYNIIFIYFFSEQHFLSFFVMFFVMSAKAVYCSRTSSTRSYFLHSSVYCISSSLSLSLFCSVSVWQRKMILPYLWAEQSHCILNI